MSDSHDNRQGWRFLLLIVASGLVATGVVRLAWEVVPGFWGATVDTATLIFDAALVVLGFFVALIAVRLVRFPR